MNTVLLVTVIGTIIVVLIVFLEKILDSRKHRVAIRQMVLRAKARALFLDEANASSDLAPLVLNLDNVSGAVIQLFGGDGCYIVGSNGAHLKKAIKKWANLGMQVTYILTRATDEVQHQLRCLVDQVGEDKLRVLLLDPSAESNPEVASLIDKYATFHPTLISLSGERKAMWIEGLHLPDSSIAYNVTFVSPEVMAETESYRQKFRIYDADVQDIEKHCSLLAA